MFGGTENRGAFTPNQGSSTSQWKSDVEWWGRSGDVCASSSGSGVLSKGTNGADHWQINAIGVTNGHYFSSQIKGFKFQASQDSGAGHGLYIRRYGFKLRSKNSSSSISYDAGGVLSRGDYGTKSYSHTFSSTILNSYLNNGYVFDEFLYQASTEGGTGKRETSVRVYNFQFDYVSSSGKQLILPIYRPYGNRSEYRIA
jgi:hypothetical protein